MFRTLLTHDYIIVHVNAILYFIDRKQVGGEGTISLSHLGGGIRSIVESRFLAGREGGTLNIAVRVSNILSVLKHQQSDQYWSYDDDFVIDPARNLSFRSAVKGILHGQYRRR